MHSQTLISRDATKGNKLVGIEHVCLRNWGLGLNAKHPGKVLPPLRATDFHVTKSKSDVHFLQHENLLREKVVLRPINNLNWQRNIVLDKLHKCCPFTGPLLAFIKLVITRGCSQRRTIFHF